MTALGTAYEWLVWSRIEEGVLKNLRKGDIRAEVRGRIDVRFQRVVLEKRIHRHGITRDGNEAPSLLEIPEPGVGEDWGVQLAGVVGSEREVCYRVGNRNHLEPTGPSVITGQSDESHVIEEAEGKDPLPAFLSGSCARGPDQRGPWHRMRQNLDPVLCGDVGAS